MIDQAVRELTPLVGVRAGCAAVGEAQARWYRRHRQSPPPPKPERVPAPQPRALSEVERKELRRVLNSEEFVDEAPATVYAKLLDQGVYLASVPTMYRVLRAHGEVHERRRQATHPAAKKPELIAAKPNEVYSWDITKLLGPAKWTYFYLYVIIDIFSRYVPGWMLAHAENTKLAEALLADTVAKQNIGHGQLTIHADRGSPMTATPVACLLADLGVTKSHSRPLGEGGPVLEGPELALAVGVVVAHVRSAVALGDPKVGQHERDGLGCHRRAPVGVDGELAVADVLLGDGVGQ